MFTGTCLTAFDDTRRNRKRAWILVSSLVVHGAALATLAAVQLLAVEAVGEPPVADVFEVQLPPPPPPSPPPAGHHEDAVKPPQTATSTPQAPPKRLLTQPELTAIPDHIPLPNANLPEDETPPANAKGPTLGGTGTGGPTIGGNGDSIGTGGNRDDGPFPVGGLISPPRIVPGTKVQPQYTDMARLAHLQGVVLLQTTIDEQGNVIDVHVLKALKMGLDREAVKAVTQWKFTPATLNGRPVKVYFNLTVLFEVH